MLLQRDVVVGEVLPLIVAIVSVGEVDVGLVLMLVGRTVVSLVIDAVVGRNEAVAQAACEDEAFEGLEVECSIALHEGAPRLGAAWAWNAAVHGVTKSQTCLGD